MEYAVVCWRVREGRVHLEDQIHITPAAAALWLLLSTGLVGKYWESAYFAGEQVKGFVILGSERAVRKAKFDNGCRRRISHFLTPVDYIWNQIVFNSLQ